MKIHPLPFEPETPLFTLANTLDKMTIRPDLGAMNALLQKLEMIQYLLTTKAIKLNQMAIPNAQSNAGIIELRARQPKRRKKAMIAIAVNTIEDLNRIAVWGEGVFRGVWVDVDDRVNSPVNLSECKDESDRKNKKRKQKQQIK